MMRRLVPRSLRLRVYPLVALALWATGGASGTEEDGADAPAATKSAKPAGPRSPAEQKLDAALQLRKLGKYDETCAALQAALGLSPPPVVAAEITFRLAETHFKKAQDAAAEKLPGVDPDPSFQSALRIFGEVVQRFPKEEITPEAVYLAGSTHLLLGDLEKALKLYQSAYSEYPSYTGRSKALQRIAVCQSGLDDPLAARRTLDRWLKEFPNAAKMEITKTNRYLMELSLIGRNAPPLKADRWIEGVASNGLESFRGEVVVVTFFATWCDHCRDELPHLRRLIKTWTPRGVTFLGISDPNDPKNTEAVEIYVKKHDIPFVDVGLESNDQISRGYLVSGLPAGAIIDRKGKVRWRGHMAFLPRPLLDKALQEN